MRRLSRRAWRAEWAVSSRLLRSLMRSWKTVGEIFGGEPVSVREKEGREGGREIE